MKTRTLFVLGLALAAVVSAGAEAAAEGSRADVWPAGRSWTADARMTIYGDNGRVVEATLKAACTENGSTTRRVYTVTSGKHSGDRYEVTIHGAGPAAQRERAYHDARKGRTRAIDTRDAGREFLDGVFTLRDLDGGFEPWPSRSVLTRAVVGGVPVEVHVAQAADERSRRRLGYWRFMTRVFDGALIQRQRFDRKDRMKSEVRYGNWTEVEGAPIAMKWEADDKASTRRSVINWSNVSLSGAAGTP